MFRIKLLSIPTSMQSARILNVVDDAAGPGRLVVLRDSTLCGRDHVVLRRETFEPGVGWFTQSQIVIEPEQVDALVATLTGSTIGTLKRGVTSTGDTPTGDAVILSFPAAG